MTEPIQCGFTYEVRLYVSIPLAWATLLKQAAKHHGRQTLDQLTNEHGMTHQQSTDRGLILLYEDPVDTKVIAW